MTRTVTSTVLAASLLAVQNVDKSIGEQGELPVSEAEVLQTVSEVKGDGEDRGVGGLRDHFRRHDSSPSQHCPPTSPVLVQLFVFLKRAAFVNLAR